MVVAAMWAAWFYMLRAKEFADSNGVDCDIILRGCDLRFAAEGQTCNDAPQEVTLRFRKTKTDQVSFGESKTLQAIHKKYLCPVEALSRMKSIWPLRFQVGHGENEKPLFRWSSGAVIQRLEVQHLLQKAAEGVDLPADRFMSDSLRIWGCNSLVPGYVRRRAGEEIGPLEFLSSPSLPRGWWRSFTLFSENG